MIARNDDTMQWICEHAKKCGVLMQFTDYMLIEIPTAGYLHCGEPPEWKESGKFCWEVQGSYVSIKIGRTSHPSIVCSPYPTKTMDTLNARRTSLQGNNRTMVRRKRELQKGSSLVAKLMCAIGSSLKSSVGRG